MKVVSGRRLIYRLFGRVTGNKRIKNRIYRAGCLVPRYQKHKSGKATTHNIPPPSRRVVVSYLFFFFASYSMLMPSNWKSVKRGNNKPIGDTRRIKIAFPYSLDGSAVFSPPIGAIAKCVCAGCWYISSSYMVTMCFLKDVWRTAAALRPGRTGAAGARHGEMWCAFASSCRRKGNSSRSGTDVRQKTASGFYFYFVFCIQHFLVSFVFFWANHRAFALEICPNSRRAFFFWKEWKSQSALLLCFNHRFTPKWTLTSLQMMALDVCAKMQAIVDVWLARDVNVERSIGPRDVRWTENKGRQTALLFLVHPFLLFHLQGIRTNTEAALCSSCRLSTAYARRHTRPHRKSIQRPQQLLPTRAPSHSFVLFVARQFKMGDYPISRDLQNTISCLSTTIFYFRFLSRRQNRNENWNSFSFKIFVSSLDSSVSSYVFQTCFPVPSL